MWEGFYGNLAVTTALSRIVEHERIPQTLLFAGPQGVGKATAARRLAAALLPQPALIEHDDLSRPEHQELLREREKMPSDVRNDHPLYFGTHPDFLTFAPDGPLRQISIPQVRLLKERAQFTPSRGSRRFILIDQIHRANEQAANSLLKVLEEPPPYLVFVLTTENYYDLLPTIRSRSVPFFFSPLSYEETVAFARRRGLDHPERRAAFAQGCPGRTISLDLEQYDRRRSVMLAFLRSAAGAASFSDWIQHSEKFLRSNQEKLEDYLELLYFLLEDLLRLRFGAGNLRDPELAADLEPLARTVSFEWIQSTVKAADAITADLRRNIQKGIALDAALTRLRSSVRSPA